MEENKEKDNKSMLSELWDLAKITAVSIVSVLLIINFIAKPVNVDGNSMFPTLKDGDYGFSSIISAKMGRINRFDVVVVNHREDNKLWVKRVIGLPGDKVEFKNDKLYINDKFVPQDFLDQDYVEAYKEETGLNFTADYGPITLKKDEYFMCGDNRPVSYDSRAVGPFKRADIKCKYALVLYPFKDWKVVTNGK